VLGTVVPSHAFLLGVFLFYIFSPTSQGRNLRESLQNAPVLLTPNREPTPSVPRAPQRVDTPNPESPTLLVQNVADLPPRTDIVKPKPSPNATTKTERPAASKKSFTKTKKEDLRRVGESPLVQVKAVFFVPQGEMTPTPEQTRRLREHLDWCRRRYGEMLLQTTRIRDSFTLADGPPDVHQSRTPLAELNAAPEKGVPRVTGELLDASGSNRFNGRYVFVVVVMDPSGSYSAGEGRPFNGGLNLGGGIVVLSSSALDGLPSFQFTLQHQLGHAFGLQHTEVYDHDMTTSTSIMSSNPSLLTDGMKPSRTPGTLLVEDAWGLSLNRRAFPRLVNFTLRLPTTSSPPDLKPFPTMVIDRQPEYQIEVTTKAGEEFGTRAKNAVQNIILPLQSRKFVTAWMWHSAHCPEEWASVVVTFPTPVTLCAVGIHSRHPGHLQLGTDGVEVEIDTPHGFKSVHRSPLFQDDSLLEFAPTAAKVWRFSFRFERGKDEIVLRGLQFFTRNGEIFPPPVPNFKDTGFWR
jgi:hypothetical protein